MVKSLSFLTENLSLKYIYMLSVIIYAEPLKQLQVFSYAGV